jgi:hypothetical protein
MIHNLLASGFDLDLEFAQEPKMDGRPEIGVIFGCAELKTDRLPIHASPSI